MSTRKVSQPSDQNFPLRSTRSNTARLLDCSRKTVERHEAAGRLTVIRDGSNGRIYHPMTEVLALAHGHAPEQVRKTAKRRVKKRIRE